MRGCCTSSDVYRQVSRKHRPSSSSTVQPAKASESIASKDADSTNVPSHQQVAGLRPPIVARNSIEVAKARAAKLFKRTRTFVSQSGSTETGESDKTTVYSRPGEKTSRSSTGPDAGVELRQSSVRFRERQKRKLQKSTSLCSDIDGYFPSEMEHTAMLRKQDDTALENAKSATLMDESSLRRPTYRIPDSLTHMIAPSPYPGAEQLIRLSKSSVASDVASISLDTACSGDVPERVLRRVSDKTSKQKANSLSLNSTSELDKSEGAVDVVDEYQLQNLSVEETIQQLKDKIQLQLASISSEEAKQRAMAPLCDLVQEIKHILPDACL